MATPLALVLLKLEAGGLKDRYDILGLCSAQKALGKSEWIDSLPEHVEKLSLDARALWLELAREIEK